MNDIDGTFAIWLILVWSAIGAACLIFWILVINLLKWVFT